MKIYVLVEGKVERIAYRYWIPFVNPKLSYIAFHAFSEAKDNQFVILDGKGNSFMLQMISKAIEDVNANDYDRLVIISDAENNSFADRYQEIDSEVKKYKCDKDIYIVIQNFCIETWALGNRKIVKRNPEGRLLDYIHSYDVLNNDPEYMPANKELGLNRSQFAYEYLKEVFRAHSKYYSKYNPKGITEKYYFDQIHNRCVQTNHIKSFGMFLDAFSLSSDSNLK